MMTYIYRVECFLSRDGRLNAETLKLPSVSTVPVNIKATFIKHLQVSILDVPLRPQDQWFTSRTYKAINMQSL